MIVNLRFTDADYIGPVDMRGMVVDKEVMMMMIVMNTMTVMMMMMMIDMKTMTVMMMMMMIVMNTMTVMMMMIVIISMMVMQVYTVSESVQKSNSTEKCICCKLPNLFISNCKCICLTFQNVSVLHFKMYLSHCDAVVPESVQKSKCRAEEGS